MLGKACLELGQLALELGDAAAALEGAGRGARRDARLGAAVGQGHDALARDVGEVGVGGVTRHGIGGAGDDAHVSQQTLHEAAGANVDREQVDEALAGLCRVSRGLLGKR